MSAPSASLKTSSPTAAYVHALVFLSLPLCAAAQYDNNWDNGNGTPGAVIAGIIIGEFTSSRGVLDADLKLSCVHRNPLPHPL